MISVSMIVKNEESCLVKCLESVRGADEGKYIGDDLWIGKIISK